MRWQRVHGRHHLPWQKTQQTLREEGVVLPYPAADEGMMGQPGAKRRGAVQDDQPRAPAAGLAAVLRDPYRVWLSEVMLQQTQVSTVIPYFEAFLQAFPQVADLAAAPSERVMGLWAGLGYYSRARNLQAAAQQVAAQGGVFPDSTDALQALPGVGRSTAAAIAVFGFGQRAAILDGNVKRVLCRMFAVAGDPASTAVQKRLWALAEAELPGAPHAPDAPQVPTGSARGSRTAAAGASSPTRRLRAVPDGVHHQDAPAPSPGKPSPVQAADMVAYTQGLMDLGAMVCTRTKPDCAHCPVSRHCQAYREGAQERYPTPRTRKAVPVRQVNLLWLQDDAGRVLMEARPEKGLWGGLWSLPELPAVWPESPAVLPQGQRRPAGAQVASGSQLASGLQPARFGRDWQVAGRFEHVFTHFRMQATLWAPERGRVMLRESALADDADETAGTAAGTTVSRAGKRLSVPVAQRAEPVGDDTGWTILPARERQRWVSAAEAEGAPLPAPILRCVRTLLA